MLNKNILRLLIHSRNIVIQKPPKNQMLIHFLHNRCNFDFMTEIINSYKSAINHKVIQTVLVLCKLKNCIILTKNKCLFLTDSVSILVFAIVYTILIIL